MRKLNCRPGDMAIVVEGFNPVNIGAAVKVIGKHRNQRVLCASPEEFIWLIEAPHPLSFLATRLIGIHNQLNAKLRQQRLQHRITL